MALGLRNRMNEGSPARSQKLVSQVDLGYFFQALHFTRPGGKMTQAIAATSLTQVAPLYGAQAGDWLAWDG